MRRTLSFRGAPGTLALKVLGVTTPLLAAAITGGAIVLSYLLLSLAFRCIPVAVAFAIWEVLGLVLVTVLGVWLLHSGTQSPAPLHSAPHTTSEEGGV